MDLSRGIAVASFGDRDEQINGLLRNIRQYTDMEVWLYTDRERKVHKCHQRILGWPELQWMDSPRWGVRNCNLWLARAALELFDTCLCLNDDMRIMSGGFIDGFMLAEKFGICVPMNPRIYVKYNAMGADASDSDYLPDRDGPEHSPACNMSPMFACKNHVGARTLLQTYMDELNRTMRGTLAFWKASWRTGFTPLYLPEQWCVGESNAAYFRDYKKVLQGKEYPIETIMLHWGQAGVREAFKGVME